jgi:CHAT domain-containing protein
LVLRGTSVETGGLANLPPLPGARAELEEMARILGGTENLVLTGGAATKSALVKLPLSRFNIITFATHGLRPIEVGARTEPALLLTPDALRNDDGLLTASNIASLRLDADWVILSACDSAGGIAAGAPAYSGLATAFLQAGARALLVSHWPVRDDAAARLTVRTVASNAPSRAAALRHAMLTLRRDKSVPGHTHPATWAPFVLIDREPAAGTERADRLQMLFPQCADVRFGDQALRSRLSATGPLSAIRVSTIHQCCSKRRLKLSAVQEP